MITISFKKIELIICFDDHSWDDNRIVEVPEHLNSTESVVDWLKENDRMDDFGNDVVFIGVYNWEIYDDE